MILLNFSLYAQSTPMKDEMKKKIPTHKISQHKYSVVGIRQMGLSNSEKQPSSSNIQILIKQIFSNAYLSVCLHFPSD